VLLVGFGDRRKAQDLPQLLREHVADEVVLVQPLHDDDDGAVALVIEPAVKGVVVPLVGGFALRVGERLLGFSGSSIRMMSAPRPVSTPPVEVASR
jgi:hypothetical protein